MRRRHHVRKKISEIAASAAAAFKKADVAGQFADTIKCIGDELLKAFRNADYFDRAELGSTIQSTDEIVLTLDAYKDDVLGASYIT